MDVEKGIEREERKDTGWTWALKKGWSGAEGRETANIVEEFGPGRMEKLANCSILGKSIRSVGKSRIANLLGIFQLRRPMCVRLNRAVMVRG